MAGPGWRALLVRADGRVRPPWRLILFVLVFPPLATAARWVVAPIPVPFELGQALGLLAAALAAGWLLLSAVDRRPPGALGFAWTERTGRELAVGMAVGAGALAAVVALLALAGMLAYRPEPGDALTYAAAVGGHLVVLAAAAAWEEALFRGYPFQVLVEWIGAIPATVLASGAFAWAHAANPNVGAFALANIFLAGVLLSAAYLRTRSLWFATAVHLGWNWVMASLFDLPVSGWDFADTPLYDPVVTGPAWLTGGAFGPEGGVVGSLAALAALVVVLKVPGLDEAPRMRELGPLVDRRLGPGRGPAGAADSEEP